ncbi:MAG: hypothetical protein DHS20C15_21420 [Planctomycetota bacterium]|nr:MAG: hypothetical protein DHS20C15_21420 [Planctomycetota bacterium]
MSDRRWTWRDAEPRDLPAQASLFNRCFRKDKQVDTFEWKYRANPHGAALSLVALNEQEEIVGGYSYMPRRFRVNGERVVLMQASDAMVDTSARRQGIFTGLDDLVAERCGEQGVAAAFAYSGRLSYNGFLGNGWRDIGQAPLFRYRFRAERSLRRRGRLGPLLAQAAPLLDASWRKRDAARAARWSAARQLLQPIERFDEGADELFEATVPERGLIGERDAAWLNWRYIDSPGKRQVCFGLPARDGRGLDGWLVAEFVGGHAYLVDHLARHDGVRTALLTAFTALAHERGVHEATALLFEHHPSAAPLRELGYATATRRKLFRDMFPYIVRLCRDDADPSHLDIDRWLLADGDRDAEHMSP